jgi:hypothetical protein
MVQCALIVALYQTLDGYQGALAGVLRGAGFEVRRNVRLAILHIAFYSTCIRVVAIFRLECLHRNCMYVYAAPGGPPQCGRYVGSGSYRGGTLRSGAGLGPARRVVSTHQFHILMG